MSTNEVKTIAEATPHLHSLLQRVEEHGGFDSVKKLLEAVTVNYTGLTRFEKCAAARMLSESAHIADPTTDEKICRAADAAQQDYIRLTGKHPFNLRVVVAQSDFAQAFAGHFPGNGSCLIVSSTLVDLLNPAELKTVLAHELGHLERHLTPSLFSQFVALPLKHAATRNATRRKMELEADAFAARLTRDPQALESALRRVDDHNVAFHATIKKILERSHDQMPLKLGNATSWLIQRAADEILERMEAGPPVRDTGWCGRLWQAPRYPTLAERIQNIGGDVNPKL